MREVSISSSALICLPLPLSGGTSQLFPRLLYPPLIPTFCVTFGRGETAVAALAQWGEGGELIPHAAAEEFIPSSLLHPHTRIICLHLRPSCCTCMAAERQAAMWTDQRERDIRRRWQRGGKRRLALPIPLIRFLSSMRLASTNQALRETSSPSFSIQYILGRKSWLFFALRPTPYFPLFPIFRGRKKYHAGEAAAIRVRNAFSFHGFFPPSPTGLQFLC